MGELFGCSRALPGVNEGKWQGPLPTARGGAKRHRKGGRRGTDEARESWREELTRGAQEGVEVGGPALNEGGAQAPGGRGPEERRVVGAPRVERRPAVARHGPPSNGQGHSGTGGEARRFPARQAAHGRVR